jgi:hypothetical protein
VPVRELRVHLEFFGSEGTRRGCEGRPIGRNEVENEIGQQVETGKAPYPAIRKPKMSRKWGIK